MASVTGSQAADSCAQQQVNQKNDGTVSKVSREEAGLMACPPLGRRAAGAPEVALPDPGLRQCPDWAATRACALGVA